MERGDDLRLHPDRAGIIASIVELLKAGLTELKPLAREDFDSSSADMSTFAMLCGEFPVTGTDGARVGSVESIGARLRGRGSKGLAPRGADRRLRACQWRPSIV